MDMLYKVITGHTDVHMVFEDNYNCYVFNGVRQGETLSPKLYNVYVDDLSDYLVKSQIGCQIDNVDR